MKVCIEYGGAGGRGCWEEEDFYTQRRGQRYFADPLDRAFEIANGRYPGGREEPLPNGSVIHFEVVHPRNGKRYRWSYSAWEHHSEGMVGSRAIGMRTAPKRRVYWHELVDSLERKKRRQKPILGAGEVKRIHLREWTIDERGAVWSSRPSLAGRPAQWYCDGRRVRWRSYGAQRPPKWVEQRIAREFCAGNQKPILGARYR